MQANLLQKTVSDVMTPSPKTACETMLVGDALRLMTEKSQKIMHLFIVENTKANPSNPISSQQKVVGLIHMHDLLRIGLA